MATFWSECNNDYPRQEVQKDLKYSSSHRAGSQRAGSPPLSPVDTYHEQEGIVLQPETRPITQEQLVNEVKGLLPIPLLSMLKRATWLTYSPGIYAGLVMVEKKCVEIDQQQAATTNKLTNEQWQALIALHRTLLHEHHDFFLASQHPSSSPALKRLATKYAMPARMWRHGIHSFLELLRHRLPDSLDHMLSFVYLAYSMMALLMESVPSFEETWIECLGDLARYRMAIEESDLRDREVWAGVARMWYDKAADKSPNVGRIQHHLAVLARPNIVQQLFYYSKALVSVNAFPNARESVMLLFNPFLASGEIASQRYPLVESAFVKAAAIQFTRGSVSMYNQLVEQFLSVLNSHIGRVTAKFRVQGPEMASTLCATLFDFGNVDAYLWKASLAYDSQLQAALENLKTSTGQTTTSTEQEASLKEEQRRTYFRSVNNRAEHPKAIHSTRDSTTKDATFSGAQDAVGHACHLFYSSNEVVFQRIGDKNILPFAHVVLAFLHSLSFIPDALLHIEGQTPWESIVTFLNTLGRSGAVASRFEGSAIPQPLSGTGRQLPEDFVMRGLVWAKHYFPPRFFEGHVVDEDERTLELPSHAAPRAERCLWLGIQLASVSCTES
jgi:Est1 DNA/RNA binding domain